MADHIPGQGIFIPQVQPKTDGYVFAGYYRPDPWGLQSPLAVYPNNAGVGVNTGDKGRVE
jgi:hypothetical protein